MDDTNDFRRLMRRVYIRVLVGAFLGGTLFVALGTYMAFSSGFVTPVAGIGILFLGMIGIVVGAILGTFSKKLYK